MIPQDESSRPEAPRPEQAWFHWRRRGEGLGYGIRHASGWVAAVVFMAVATGTSVLGHRLMGPEGLWQVRAVMGVELALFLWFVDRHSDRGPGWGR
ncbi:MAG TPA: hypothetical protein VN222_11555 [Novosphingobium sp.]|nr:hypothetical protein [Novosphingobium sp.]